LTSGWLNEMDVVSNPVPERTDNQAILLAIVLLTKPASPPGIHMLLAITLRHLFTAFKIEMAVA
jgi:hypothetical protein